MLIYNPVFDLYHCVFRHLKILEKIGQNRSVSFERLRIIDFYLLFPQELRSIRFPQKIIKYRKYLPKDDNYFESVKNPNIVFNRLEQIEKSAVQCLVLYGLIDSEEYKKGKICRSDKEIPSELKEKLNQTESESFNVLALLVGPLLDVDLIGDNGLKARTKLIEHRYDKT